MPNLVRSLVICSLLYVGSVHAGFCLTPSPSSDDPYTFIASFADALIYAKQGMERMAGTKLNQEPGDDLKLMIALKQAKDDYLCAASQVAPYKVISSSTKPASNDDTTSIRLEAITGSSKAAEATYSTLAKINDDVVMLFQTNLDELDNGKMKVGTFTERSAELIKRMDDAWKTLVPAAIMASYALVDQDPETKLMSRLALTSRQRDELEKKFVTAFGNEIREGPKAGQPAVKTAAAFIYQVLAQPRETRKK